MKSIMTMIVLLLGLATGTAQAQFYQPPGGEELGRNSLQRFSPHYYKVKNILSHHSFLRPAEPDVAGNSFTAKDRISVSELQLETDVVFQNGAYEFRARLQGYASKVQLRKRDARWILELVDDFDGRVRTTYVLER